MLQGGSHLELWQNFGTLLYRPAALVTSHTVSLSVVGNTVSLSVVGNTVSLSVVGKTAIK